MIVTVLSPDKEIFSGEASSVKLPGKSGGFEVLNGHAPLLSSLEAGVVLVKTATGKQEILITAGVVEVLRNEVSVLVEQA